MKLAYLQALRAVMQTGTATGAAIRLRRTQPQVSRMLAELERQLGFEVFSRQRKRLVPTREGLEFYSYAMQVLTKLDDLPDVIKSIRSRPGEFLRIGCQTYIAQALLPDALAAFAGEEPRFRFAVEIQSRAELGRVLLSPPYDLAVVALPIEHDLLVRCEPFAVATVVAVLPREHRLADRSFVDVTDLASEPFIALTRSTLLRPEIDRMFFELGVSLDIRGEASAGIATCQMVAKGLGVTLADPLEASHVPADAVVVRELRPKLTFTYGFLFPCTFGQTALTLRVAECIARTAKERNPKHIQSIPFSTAARAGSSYTGS